MDRNCRDIVYIRDLQIETIIGIYDWERKIKQTVSIDIEMETDIRVAAESDNIEDTLNYKAVGKRINQFVEASDYHLVETMAERIAQIVLCEFDVKWLRLRVSKPGALTGSSDVGLIIERSVKSSEQYQENNIRPNESPLVKTKVFLGIGSNINREKAIKQALTLLQKEFTEIEVSPVFESEPVGFSGDNFYNLVISFSTSYSLFQVVSIYKGIEDQLGRDRSGPKFSARTLDIDALIYGDLVCKQPIIIPRDEILENAFVLWPLSILAPEEKHPQTGLSFAEHWKKYDKDQKLWQVDFK